MNKERLPNTIHEEAHAVIDRLPPSATWDDLLDAIYDRLTIERGLAASAAGRLVLHEKVAQEFGFVR